MARSQHLRQLERLGYQVRPAMFVDTRRPTVFFIEGHGISVYVNESDDATLGGLVSSHEDRMAAQQQQP